MDRLYAMEAFVRVVESGSFTAAAESLHQSPSAMSKLIARLEDRLNVRLLQRTTRRVLPTAEGRRYYEESRALLAEVDALESSVGGAGAEPRGLLRVTVAHGFGMAQVVPQMKDFLARFPAVELQISFADHLVDLVAEGIDIGVRLGTPGDDALVGRKIADYRRQIYATPDYLARHGTPRHPRDLRLHRAVLSSSVLSLNRWPMKMPDGSVEEIEMQGAAGTNSGDAMHEMVMEGLGLGYTADFLTHRARAEGKLVTVLDDFLIVKPQPIYAVYPARKHLAAKVRAFVDYLSERFSPIPPWAV